MDASFKKRFAQVLIAGSAMVLVAACNNDMLSMQPMPNDKPVVVKDHECRHHNKHHNHHKHHRAHHNKKHHKQADTTKKASAAATNTQS
ncbi:MAG: hypothetical protein A3F18_08005 [Legionellales bacterium RIFCSPHIGHO2_12_FULL_37_14]|nr:MAG: hypothetical protein A3F18_08005 [Legionellales bacterium RIFCSPHIGHO2_12_FULL_37_14]